MQASALPGSAEAMPHSSTLQTRSAATRGHLKVSTETSLSANSQAVGDLEARLQAAQAQIDDLKGRLEHQERLATLGTIASFIAHEFNNILTPVVSYAQLALADPGDAALAHKALTRALTGSERASAIAGAILDFARDDQSALPSSASASMFHVEHHADAEPPRASVVQGVDDAVACLGRELSRDGIELELQIDVGLEAPIKPVALQHVLLNLMLNSRNAMLPSGGRLIITGRHPRQGEVAIAISDTGRGMSAQALEQLFVPFAAGRRASAGPHKSSGLGMTICKRLIEDAGGRIHVASTPGRGTTVELIWLT